MRVDMVRTIPVMLVALLACGGSTLPSEDTLQVQPATRQVTPGSDLNLTFENHSSADVEVTELSCTSTLQRLTPNGWVEVDESLGCIRPVHAVPAGGVYAFTRRMPAITGTFRLEVLVTRETGASGAPIRVYSPSIEVAWPRDARAELAAIVSVAEVAPGADLAVQFENRSNRQVAVGELSCVTDFEQKTAGGWQRVGSLRMCIELLRLVEGGTSFGYVTPAPGNAGTYRVYFRAFPTGEGGAVEVRSGEFEVKE